MKFDRRNKSDTRRENAKCTERRETSESVVDTTTRTARNIFSPFLPSRNRD